MYHARRVSSKRSLEMKRLTDERVYKDLAKQVIDDMSMDNFNQLFSPTKKEEQTINGTQVFHQIRIKVYEIRNEQLFAIRKKSISLFRKIRKLFKNEKTN